MERYGRIFVFGAHGMLGNYVCSYLYQKEHKVVGVFRQDFDISSLTIPHLIGFFEERNISDGDIVINCAGVIPQSGQKNLREYFTINSLFPVVLSLICQQRKVQMIHITTDCVFKGESCNYDENCLSDEISDYGVSKSLGDLADCCIIRTSIIGEEKKGKRSLLEWVRSNQGQEINGYTDHLWNGVTCLQLAKIIHSIIQQKSYWKGIRHIFSPRSVSKYELVSLINQIYDLGIKINPVSTARVDKTLSSIYPLGLIPDIAEQISELREFTITTINPN